MDLMGEMKDFVGVDVEGIDHFQINVVYHTLPNTCFYCHYRGHLIRDYEVLHK